MPVYCSDQYTSDFSPYLRHIFAVKHIYLTLYIVCMCSAAPICSVPARSHARARVAVLAALAVCAAVWPCPRPCLPAYLRPCVRPGPCARLLMPGQRWTFLSAAPVRPALLARVCARCARPLCVAALASVVRVILFAYMVASPAVLPRAGLAANFFEIVFKPSISIPPSST